MKAFTTNVVKSIFLPLSVIILVGCGSGTDDTPKDTIVHNGVTYDTVASPYTGRIWLDRNLGAARVCTSFNDTACYGDYYQWGRNADGHEDMGSPTTTTLATNVNNVGHGKFIFGHAAWASVDTSYNTRKQNWLKTDGTSVCPTGFRLPTITELKAETINQGVINRATAFSNFLKLPSAGYRSYSLLPMQKLDQEGFLWASTPRNDIRYLELTAGVHNSVAPSFGLPVRCIKD